jgi:hypothetical protein
MGPQDPSALKQACKTVKKLVISMDSDKEAACRTILPLVMDLTMLAFALWNAANALVTKSASIWGMFVCFHEQISGSLDKMIERNRWQHRG